MKKKILITGATGLVGTALLEKLLEEDFAIYAISRSGKAIINKNLIWIKRDISKSQDQLIAQLPDVDIVVHAAAAVNVVSNLDEKSVFQRTNTEFSNKLFKNCANTKVRTVIYISAFNFLKTPLEKEITELHPVLPTTNYGLSKYEAELALFQYADTQKYRPVSLRISSPIAFNFDLLHNTVVKKWINDGIQGKTITIYGDGSRTQDFVATEDIAQSVIKAIGSQTSGVYNIASGASITMVELANIISSYFDTNVKFEGKDAKEGERWNISIMKAAKYLNYKPTYNSQKVIEKLLISTV